MDYLLMTQAGSDCSKIYICTYSSCNHFNTHDEVVERLSGWPVRQPHSTTCSTSLNGLFVNNDGKVRTWRGTEKTARVLFVPSSSHCFVNMNVYQLAQFSTLLHCIFFNLTPKSGPTY